MLTLADASSFFDLTPVLHPDTGVTLFHGQVEVFDDSKRDSATAYRRILSVVPGTVMPAARAVRILGAVWLVGGLTTDGLETAHRDKYVLHPARGQFTIRTLAQHLAGAGGVSSWGDLEWVKDSRETEVSSEPVPLYNLYLPKVLEVVPRQVAVDGSRTLLVSAVRPQPSDLQAAMGELAEEPVGQVTVTSNVYNPIAGSYTPGAAVNVACLKLRWQALFEYGSQSDEKYQEGDCNFAVPLGTSVTTSSVLTYAAKQWRVLTLEVVSGVLLVHGRPR